MNKRLLLLLMVMGFAVGCTSTPEADQGETAPAPAAAVEENDAAAMDAAAMKEAMEPVAEEQPSAAMAADSMAADSMDSSTGAGKGGVTSYMVERGDNLWSISAKDDIYGNPYQWPLIFKANREKIKDADLIYPGQDLSIVRGMSDEMINAAVNHARTRGAWSLGEVEATDQAYLNE